MNLSGTSFIGFSRAGGKGTAFYGVDAATGESLAPAFHSATLEEVDRACRLAAEAFVDFGRMSGKRKARLLSTVADRLEALAGPIIERACLETALPVPRLQSEMGRTSQQLRLFAGLIEEGSWVDARIDHADPQRLPLPKPDVRSMLRPLGPVAVFGASNFPLAFSAAGGDTASALAAGCPVIVKAHPAHPGTSELAALAVQEAARACDMPEGIFSLLFDSGYQVGLALVKQEAVKAVGFTGSRRAGRALMQAAGDRQEPIPVYAEMSSINPVIILPGAMRLKPTEIAAGLQASVTLGVGQFCTNPGLVLVENGEAVETFLRELEQHMAAAAPGTMLTSGICSAYQAGVQRFSGIKGVQQRAGASAGGNAGQAVAALFSTTAEVFLSNPELMDEIFGPSTLVVRCEGRSQLLAAARALEGQLTATIHGTEADLADCPDLAAIVEMKAGRLIFNAYPTGVEVCHAMVHGGPYPATSDGRSTSVGTRAIQRFVRPVCYQNMPGGLLPEELQEANPLALWRLEDGHLRREKA